MCALQIKLLLLLLIIIIKCLANGEKKSLETKTRIVDVHNGKKVDLNKSLSEKLGKTNGERKAWKLLYSNKEV